VPGCEPHPADHALSASKKGLCKQSHLWPHANDDHAPNKTLVPKQDAGSKAWWRVGGVDGNSAAISRQNIQCLHGQQLFSLVCFCCDRRRYHSSDCVLVFPFALLAPCCRVHAKSPSPLRLHSWVAANLLTCCLHAISSVWS
jgi:hypothetical protein